MAEGKFHTERFMGRWYEIARTPRITFQHGKDAVFVFSKKKDGMFELRLKQTPEPIRRKTNSARVFALPEDPSQMHIFFKSHPLYSIFFTDFRVIAVDYDDYAIVHSINPVFFFWKVEWAWILSRSPKVSPEKLDRLLSELEQLTSIKKDQMIINSQNNVQ